MGDRAVYCARLESVCAFTGTQGSNPCPSVAPRRAAVFCAIAASWLVCAFSVFAAEQKVAGFNPLEDAQHQLESGQSELALKSFLAQNEGELSAEALDLRGAIYLDLGRFDEAIADFRAAQEKNPALAGPRMRRGDALLRQKKWAEARAVYEEVLKKSSILILSERARYAVLLTHLGEKNDEAAKRALDRLVFPTETPGYYYGQAAWAFAHGDQKGAEKWMKTADGIFEDHQTAWFERPLFDLGWIKKKPNAVLD